MRRRLLKLLTGLLLLLFAGTCVLWVRSYSVADSFVVTNDRWQDEFHCRSWQCSVTPLQGMWVIRSNGGGFDFSADPDIAREERQRQGIHFWRDTWRGDAMSLVSPRRSWFGFGWEHVEADGRYGKEWMFETSVPAWLPVIVAALPAATRLARASRRRWRRNRNECPGCAYDLTSNVSGVCPECGAALTGAGGSAAGRALPWAPRP